MKNSLKQIFRTPLITGFFCIIFIFGIILFTIGLNLWSEIMERLKIADDVFVTIGTVRQKEQSTTIMQYWDAGLKDYIYQETSVYGNFLTTDVLKTSEIKYISEPLQRPYFGALFSESITGGEHMDDSISSMSLVEIRALENCVPKEPINVEVVDVLWGTKSLIGKKIYFCDHRTEQPEDLEKGKIYITFISVNFLNTDKHEGLIGMEYMPLRIYENQTQNWYEVTDDFYETEDGIRWKNIAKALKASYEKMVPVTPVNDLYILRPFHNGDAVLVEGRNIEESEYKSGAKVCLIPQKFAKQNSLSVGDSLPLQLYFADYKYPLCEVAWEDGGLNAVALDKDGNMLDAFQKSEYKIIGIYSYSVKLTNDPDAFVKNQIFVPVNSISESFEDHILEHGPMQPYNTSFRIKNGDVGRFTEAYSKLPESNLLEIEFDDGGYAIFASKMRKSRIVAGVLFFTGLALLLTTITFLIYFFILKQSRRTAIERALGMTKKQCIVSMMSGILVLTTICGTIGTTVGMKMNNIVQEVIETGVDNFSTAYTKGLIEDNEEIFLESDNKIMWRMTGLAIICEIGLVWIFTFFFIRKNLNIPPISILSSKEDE